jgi:hypothetical protein
LAARQKAPLSEEELVDLVTYLEGVEVKDLRKLVVENGMRSMKKPIKNW